MTLHSEQKKTGNQVLSIGWKSWGRYREREDVVVEGQ